MNSVQSYRDLKVWQKSIEFSRMIYEFSRLLPREETYGLIAKMRRAAVSIPANIAEGLARQTPGEFRQFLGVAQGNLAEVVTFLVLSKELAYATSEIVERLLIDCEEIRKMLTALRSLSIGR